MLRLKWNLDTSVVFAAILSETGGARVLFQLGEVGVIQLILGPNVLRECEEVARRKIPASLPTLAYLLELGGVEICSRPEAELVEQAYAIGKYRPDAYVLAEAKVLIQIGSSRMIRNIFYKPTRIRGWLFRLVLQGI